MKDKDKSAFYLWLGFALVCVFAGINAYVNFRQSFDAAQERIEMQKQLTQELLEKNSCISTKDSLFRINAKLSIYKTLTEAMVYRDDITKQLPHHIGENVIVKNDSARVTIEDIVIGGSKYNFYVKYKVKYKDNTTQELIPELIY